MMGIFSWTISKCRVCHSSDLAKDIELGEFYSCGTFPASKDEIVPASFLSLRICKNCLLVQLGADFDTKQLFSMEYGYKSSLNNSMISHLQKVAQNLSAYHIKSHDLAYIDIGSNDGTLIEAISPMLNPKVLIGVDPIVKKFEARYEELADSYAEFWSRDFASRLTSAYEMRFNLITSIAMFYDLPDPSNFVEGIKIALDSEGIWVVEVSYLYSMIKNNAFDTICHEHLEYYSCRSIKWLLDKHDMKVVNFALSSTNGGSMILHIAHGSSVRQESREFLNTVDAEPSASEEIQNLLSEMIMRVNQQINDAHRYLSNLDHPKNLFIYGLGASTKGNTFLQYAKKLIPYLRGIGEINEDKVGKFTPGTLIPILNETELNSANLIFLVLPWHFKENFLTQWRERIENENITLIFILPEFEVVDRNYFKNKSSNLVH